MLFADLIESRLAFVEGYHSAYHSREYRYMAARWLKWWPGLKADDITLEMVEAFLLYRRKKSALAANKDLRYLKAAFNWGIKRGYCTRNPVKGLPCKIFLTARLRSYLEFRFAKRQRDDKWVFTNRYFSRKSGRWVIGPFLDRKQLMRKLCRAAGLEYFRYHAIRHSGASAMERAGVPITSIQAILGHETRLTTEIYLHSVGQAERAAMEVFEKLG